MADEPISLPEIASRNSVAGPAPAGDDLATWLEAYFQLAVTTAESSRAVQRRDVGRFLSFMQGELGVFTPSGASVRRQQLVVKIIQKSPSDAGWNAAGRRP